MQTISWQDFEMVELRVGTLVRVEPFPRGAPPRLQGVGGFRPRARGAQEQRPDHRPLSTGGSGGPPDRRRGELSPKQIGPIQSEFLLTGFYRPDGAVVIAIPEQAVENGAKLG